MLNLDWLIIAPFYRHGVFVLPYVHTSEIRRLILEVKHTYLIRISLWTAAVWQLSSSFEMLNICTFFLCSPVVVPTTFLFANGTRVDDVIKVDSVRNSRLTSSLVDLD